MIFERNQGRGRIWKLFKGNATRWGGWGSYELEVHSLKLIVNNLKIREASEK